ncbi:MAG: hypothetical protein ABI411_15840 [Tahibacter sp.]
MRTVFPVLLIVATVCTEGLAQSANSTSTDVIYVGTVSALTASALGQSEQNWTVVTDVQTVESGSFTGRTFSFRVHSPARAGLVVGRRYRFHAARRGDGYVIDDMHIEAQD